MVYKERNISRPHIRLRTFRIVDVDRDFLRHNPSLYHLYKYIHSCCRIFFHFIYFRAIACATFHKNYFYSLFLSLSHHESVTKDTVCLISPLPICGGIVILRSKYNARRRGFSFSLSISLGWNDVR